MNELPETVVEPHRKPQEETRARKFPPYHVILLNDDDHSAEFVVEVLRKALAYSEQKAFTLMHEAHTRGRSIVWTGPREVAELKAEQIRSFHEIRQDGRKLGPLGVDLEAAE